MNNPRFYADWMWHHDFDSDVDRPHSVSESTAYCFTAALRALRILERHGVLIPDMVSWVVPCRPGGPTRAGAWPVGGTDVEAAILTQDLLTHITELDPAPTSIVDATFRGTCRVVQPGGATVVLPDATTLRVLPDEDLPLVVLATTTDVWTPRNRFGEPQPELHDLNAPRLAACLTDISAELGWEFEPDDDPKPCATPTATGLDNTTFYDRQSLGYTASPPATTFLAGVPESSPIGRFIAVAPKNRPIAGSAEALDAWGEWLRRQITTAAAAVPGVTADVLDPRITECRPLAEPGVYRQIESVDGDRGRVAAAEFVRRITEHLVDGGWHVDERRHVDPAPVPNRVIEATASRRDCEVTVRAWTTDARFVVRGATPRIRLYPRRAWVRPQRVVFPNTVSSGSVLCCECDGWGSCPCCEGQGWLPDSERRCPLCDHLGGSRGGDCPICRGRGELSVDKLTRHQRESYPHLRER